MLVKLLEVISRIQPSSSVNNCGGIPGGVGATTRNSNATDLQSIIEHLLFTCVTSLLTHTMLETGTYSIALSIDSVVVSSNLTYQFVPLATAQRPCSLSEVAQFRAKDRSLICMRLCSGVS